MLISIIIPAHQESETISECLSAIISQTLLQNPSVQAEVVVLANACADDTVEKARSLEGAARTRGLALTVIDDPVGGKSRALNRADGIARGSVRVYLDADVVCAPDLLAELARELDTDAPRFASGTVRIPPSRSWVSRCYARIWSSLPFVTSDVAGCGLYAVNAAGRRRWGRFPELHSDDKFVRLQFAAHERRRVAPEYVWSVPDGLARLIRVRRRWCEGNAELRRLHPELRDTRAGTARQYLRLIAGAPVSATVFTAVYLGGALLALGHGGGTPVEWRRGR